MAWLRSVVTGLPRVVFMHRDCGLMTLRIGPGRSLMRSCLFLRAPGPDGWWPLPVNAHVGPMTCVWAL